MHGSIFSTLPLSLSVPLSLPPSPPLSVALSLSLSLSLSLYLFLPLWLSSTEHLLSFVRRVFSLYRNTFQNKLLFSLSLSPTVISPFSPPLSFRSSSSSNNTRSSWMASRLRLQLMEIDSPVAVFVSRLSSSSSFSSLVLHADLFNDSEELTAKQPSVRAL